MITDVIEQLIGFKDLTEDEARSVMEEIMAGQSTDAQVAAFLTALRMKGETADEMVGLARVMRQKAASLWEGEGPEVVDTCGTGGDRSGTFNISTAAAFVAAGAGALVAKHGNRSVSSRCGSADVMEALGVNIQMPAVKLRQAILEVGIGFLFAPSFHSSMQHVMPARSQMKVRTVFNILGPLSNPAAAAYQVIGVSTESLLDLMAEAVARLGARHAFIVHGSDGIDEISISAPTTLVEVSGSTTRRFSVRPEDFGLQPAGIEAIKGGDAAENARIVEEVLAGAKSPRRDVVLMNAAAAITAAGISSDLQAGVERAEASLDSGAALERLQGLRAMSS